ncbi:MAG TPA: valine--tRNA ligase [Candidatus Onthocola stercorigallinarum]|nr:valine--tRNA ligase [Candidatus Onthocola stercorigallinarum]
MLDKKYNHLIVEEGKYETWLKYFEEREGLQPYAIVIPPPNVTGKLHLGHAWDTTLQDIIIRFKRMQGYNAMWLPGMDHAGIATQAKVDAKLKSMGINPRSLSREEWLKYAWDWKDEYADNIHKQWAKLGLSLCYSKERFTLDEGLNKAVNHVFKTLYAEGLIYRGERIINWDPLAMTALSNEEVIYKETKGAFYHIKYFIAGTKDYLEVATTRPETLFGDTAVAVNPSDNRYNKLIGKMVILPLVNKMIPIIGDEHADPEFGTGIVKITPAHDPNDFEVGNRHNLERVVVMNPDGTMNANAGKYEGLDRFACRDAVVKDLEKEGLLISVKEITHNVGHSERSGVMIEPFLSKQWFVKMRPLADAVLENQKNKDTKVNFVPVRFEKIMNHWMEITYDWCISRQLWWGHRIPAWYKGDEVYVGDTAPDDDWVQDPDVLDTWFSSALWPFSTLGWPDYTKDYEKFYPNNVLVTGYDIIPFWVNRMTFQGLHFTGQRPFKDCLIHGLIRDKEGRKMSKSLGNGVDPMDVIEKYGADALRYFLATSSAAGMDLRYDEDKVAASWNFINKLWNASRFVLMNIDSLNETNYTLDDLKQEDKWILTKLNTTIKTVTKHMEKYEFNIVGSEIYNFVWNDFCDNYIEFAKFNLDNLTTKSVLLKVLTDILKMLHPFMPYVTDEVYNMLPIKEESIIISHYPKYNKQEIYLDETNEVDNMLEFIKNFRTVKLENKIGSNFEVSINKENNYDLIFKVLKITPEKQVKESSKKKINVKYLDYDINLYYEIVLSEEDRDLKAKQLESLKQSIERRKKLLANSSYVNKAPKELVEKERMTLKEEEEKLKLMEEN